MRKEKLSDLRKEVDRLDEEILRLLKERLDIVKRIGEMKAREKIPVWDPAREKEVLRKIQEKAQRLGINPKDVEAVYREVIGMSRRVQEEIKVAFLGPEGTITEEAAHAFFPSAGVSFIPCPSITDVFKKVESGDATCGVIPVESSIEGSVTASLDQFLSSNVMICGEVELKVEQNLILHPSTRLGDVKLILSHPQALAQCRKYIEKHLPYAKVKEMESTASAVRALLRTRNAAAIGSEAAARLYGMKIEARGIQDEPSAFTRFCILGKSDCGRTGNDKTSIIFSVEHVPGALYRALEPFALRKINITRIESRPTKRKPWEYFFFLDFQGHRKDPTCKEALEELKKKTTFLKVLGSYPAKA